MSPVCGIFIVVVKPARRLLSELGRIAEVGGTEAVPGRQFYCTPLSLPHSLDGAVALWSELTDGGGEEAAGGGGGGGGRHLLQARQGAVGGEATSHWL